MHEIELRDDRIEIRQSFREQIEFRDGSVGPPGNIGQRGEKGDPGEDGAPGGSTHVHVQGSSSKEWNVLHDLGRHPSVTVVDSAGTTVIGTVTYVDSNNVRISFAYPFSGRAFFN